MCVLPDDKVTVTSSFPVQVIWEMCFDYRRMLEPRLRRLEQGLTRESTQVLRSLLNIPTGQSVSSTEPEPMVRCGFEADKGAEIPRESVLLHGRMTISKMHPQQWLNCEADRQQWAKRLLDDVQAHYIRLSSGKEFVVLRKCVRLPRSQSWWKAKIAEQKQKKRKVGAAPREIEIAHFANLLPHECEILNMPPSDSEPTVLSSDVPTFYPVDRRFNKKVVWDFASLSRLRPGDVVAERQPLFLAYDPILEKLRRDGKGNNCLTNGWDLSIPLFWPDNWNQPELERCIGLSRIPSRYYELHVRTLIGKRVNEILELQDDRMGVEESSGRGRESCACGEYREGQCYDGDCKTLTLVGPFKVFEIDLNGASFWYVDSPLYGVAFRVYQERAHALMWAQGGVERQRLSQLGIQALLRLFHDPDQIWRKRLQEFESGGKLPMAESDLSNESRAL